MQGRNKLWRDRYSTLMLSSIETDFFSQALGRTFIAMTHSESAVFSMSARFSHFWTDPDLAFSQMLTFFRQHVDQSLHKVSKVEQRLPDGQMFAFSTMFDSN